MNEIASRYGLALFQIAEENNQIVALNEEIKVLKNILDNEPEYISLLNSSFINFDEKIEYIDKAFKDVDKNVLSLIKILIKNNRVRLIKDVLEYFITLSNEAMGILQGLVYSIKPLSKEMMTSLETKLSKLEKRKIHLINKIDSTLIGGVKVVINDHVYDGTIKNQIEQLKLDLMKKED